MESHATIGNEMAGLIYGSDSEPGFRRVRCGRGFRYVAPNGEAPKLHDLDRIAALVIPPAWNDVWIARSDRSHLQATGRDARNRKQSIYHSRWREIRDETKFNHLLLFGTRLRLIRERTERDLIRRDVGKDRIVAVVVRLLDLTALRIGNERYHAENGSDGLTTLRRRHVNVSGQELCFQFIGKSGKRVTVGVQDRRLARIVGRLQDLPGQELFCYQNGDGTFHPVTSVDVNTYLAEVAGNHFTAKEFRTWTASTIVAERLAGEHADSNETVRATKAAENQALDEAAHWLNNTRAVCRNSYVHPEILRGFEDGWLGRSWAAGAARVQEGMLPAEAGLMAVLRRAKRA